jgi:hypothetical protein
MKSIGIDLAALEENPTGFVVMHELRARTKVLYNTDEILEEIFRENPDITAIDAPLSFPEDMKGFRGCDKRLIKLGYKVFPPTFRHMKRLTQRGIEITSTLKRGGFNVIEIHPKTSMKILGLFNHEDLERVGIVLQNENISKHEFDAVLAAYTGFLHLKRKTRRIKNEGEIVIPV